MKVSSFFSENPSNLITVDNLVPYFSPSKSEAPSSSRDVTQTPHPTESSTVPNSPLSSHSAVLQTSNPTESSPIQNFPTDGAIQ